MIEKPLSCNKRAVWVSDPSDLARLTDCNDTEVLDIESKNRLIVAADCPPSLLMPNLKALSISNSGVSLTRLFHLQTLNSIEKMAIADCDGALTLMAEMPPLRSLVRLTVLRTRLQNEELSWITNQSMLIGLQVHECHGLPLNVLEQLSCFRTIRTLSLAGCWDTIPAEFFARCYPTVRYLDISRMSIPPHLIGLIGKTFPNVKFFRATECGLCLDDIKVLKLQWKLTWLLTGNREVDFNYCEGGLFNDAID